MSILSISVSHVILKLATVYVSFCVPESSLTFSFVEVPLSFIVSTVDPVLNSITVPEFIKTFVVLTDCTWSSVTHSGVVVR